MINTWGIFCNNISDLSKTICKFYYRTRSKVGSSNSIQARSNTSSGSSSNNIDVSGGQYGVQRQRSYRSIGLRRLVAWTRSVAPPPPSTPQIRLQQNIISDNRIPSTSAPVSCKEANCILLLHLLSPSLMYCRLLVSQPCCFHVSKFKLLVMW